MCVFASTQTTLSFSSQPFPLHILWPYPRQPHSGSQRWVGGCTWGCDGRSGARVHQAWLPSDAGEAGLKWVCVTSRIAGRGQAGGRVGRVTLMHPGSVGSFHRTLKHTLCSHTGAHTNTRCLPPLALDRSGKHTQIQTSSRHCREAVSDEIKWSRGTSLLCYKSLHAVILCERCSTSKSILMSSTMETSG